MKYCLILLLSFWIQGAMAQQSSRNDCGTLPPAQKPVISPAMRQSFEAAKVLYTTPYPIRVFIIVFANDDGSNVAAPEADVLRQFENMRIAYQPHNICFILSGYEVRNNSDLNTMNKDEADDASQVSALALSNCFTIFIHASLTSNDGSLNGSAYAIPNHFLSMSRGAITSTTNLSTMPHEFGHCLGLLHTFEDYYGAENRDRSGSCKDCEDDGDLLCDTQADRNVDDDFISVACVYTGSLTDECGDALLMEETNIMTYGRRSCRQFFTAGQRTRMHTYLLSSYSGRIADDNIFVVANAISSGRVTHAARNSITVSPGAGSYVLSGSVSGNFSSRAITLLPGVELKPSTGYVQLKIDWVYCQ